MGKKARDQLKAVSRAFGRDWWKLQRISPEKFKCITLTGDILLFRSHGNVPQIIRTFSGGRFDHVGLLLKLAGGEIGILEATGNQGVGLCTWSEFLENGWEQLYPEMAVRRVVFPRTTERLVALQNWVGEVLGKPYGLSIGRMMQKNSISA